MTHAPKDRLRRGLAHLWVSDRHGVASIELAIIAPVLLTLAAIIGDYARGFEYQSQLEDAVMNGAAYAFAIQQSKGTVQASDVQTAVRSSTALSLGNVQVTGPQNACVTQNIASSPPTSQLIVSANPYGSSCPSGDPVSSFITIVASYNYTPMRPLYSKLVAQTFTSTAIVRLF